MNRLIEMLTDELKSLVGWGATPKALVCRPVLRSLFDVDDLSPAGAGNQMRRELDQRINLVTGIHVIDRMQVPHRKIIPALRVSLALTARDSAFKRRPQAMAALGYYGSVETWRREFGPERELMHVLAEHLLDLHQASQDAELTA